MKNQKEDRKIFNIAYSDTDAIDSAGKLLKMAELKGRTIIISFKFQKFNILCDVE